MPEINDLNYERMLDDALTPVMLVFKASFCGPTAMLEPLLEDMADELTGKLLVVDVDVEKCPNITRTFQVKQTPTMVVVKGREPVASRLGTSTYEELIDWTTKTLAKIG